MEKARVVVISLNQFFREGVRHVLGNTRYEVVGNAAIACDVISGVQDLSADLLIWGPGITDDVEAAQLRSQLASWQSARLVAVMDTKDTPWVRRVAALGVDAILSHSIPVEVFPRMLEIVLLGGKVFPALGQWDEIEMNELVARARAGAGMGAITSFDKIAFAGLTEREVHVLQLIVNGASNKIIARELHVTEPTVKAHVKGVLRKIGVSNRTQAAVWATRAPP